MDSEFLLKKIKEFVPLQKALLKKLFEDNPESKTLNIFVIFRAADPSCLTKQNGPIKDTVWDLLLLNTQDGGIITAHDNISEPEYFDSWRLETLIESQTHQSIQKQMLLPLFEDLIKQGLIIKYDHKGWTLRDKPLV